MHTSIKSNHSLKSHLGFEISAPAMVYGPDPVKNIRKLAPLVNNIELVLFYTPDLNNFPKADELAVIRQLGEIYHLTYTVHLPASLEIASDNDNRRKEAVQIAIELIRDTSMIHPLHYILHVPFTKPTLVADPDQYIDHIDDDRLASWINTSELSLHSIYDAIAKDSGLLLENINYSTTYLAKLLKRSRCRLCLDIGHLMLGREDVSEILRQYLPITDEIHLHGVRGSEEHLGLGVLAISDITAWLDIIKQHFFSGVINLEMFTPTQLKESIEIIDRYCGNIALE